MPSLTFEKLKPHKQARIIRALIREFSRWDFHNASVDRIAADAEVAKGSFYQYFADKSDMYAFAVDNALDSYRQALVSAIAGVKDFAEAISELTKSHFIFLTRHPHEAGLLYNSRQPGAVSVVYLDEDSGEPEEEKAECLVMSTRREILAGLLEKYCSQLSKPEQEFLSFMLNEGFNGCEMFVQMRGKFILQEFMHEEEPEIPLPKAQTDLLAYMMSASCAMLARQK